ncbi:MAG TPA: DoxX family protein [Terracidiphilus sp.]|jgi:putative oxidoreductase|nr:DoxX family protein [Terracidiphilus sp.]
MNESSSGALKFRNSVTDWALRAVIFAAFVFFGGGKFNTNTNAAWIQLFNDIGFGQWFRTATGVVELLGAFLTLFPQTVSAGLALLGTTMVGAILIDVIVLRRIPDALIPFAILGGLIALWLRRRRV